MLTDQQQDEVFSDFLIHGIPLIRIALDRDIPLPDLLDYIESDEVKATIARLSTAADQQAALCTISARAVAISCLERAASGEEVRADQVAAATQLLRYTAKTTRRPQQARSVSQPAIPTATEPGEQLAASDTTPPHAAAIAAPPPPADAAIADHNVADHARPKPTESDAAVSNAPRDARPATHRSHSGQDRNQHARDAA